jgi:hypothetical protein
VSGCNGSLSGRTFTTGAITATCTVSAIFTHSAITANIVSGWNLLGNSVNASLTVAATFGNSTNVSTVWKWEPNGTNLSISYPAWAFYSPILSDGGASYAATKGYDFLTTINGGEGFWVNAKTTFTASLPSGVAILSSAFSDQTNGKNNLPTGWSLIATGDNPSPKVFVNTIALYPPVGSAAATSLTTLWAWDSGSSNWYFYAPNLDNGSTLSSYITGKNYEDFTAKGKSLDSTTGFWANHP